MSIACFPCLPKVWIEIYHALCVKAIYYLKLLVYFLFGCCTPLSCGLGVVWDFRLPNVPEYESSF